MLVLIVDDRADVAEMATDMVQELGHETITRTSAAAALALFRERSDVELLFTDIVMPGDMTGIEMARAARSLHPMLKVILTTGFTEVVIAPGEFPVLFKPYGLTALEDAFARLER